LRRLDFIDAKKEEKIGGLLRRSEGLLFVVVVKVQASFLELLLHDDSSCTLQEVAKAI